MTSHPIEQHELITALAEYVVRRDGLDAAKTHRANITTHCEIMQIGAPGPMFTVHLSPAVMSAGGSS